MKLILKKILILLLLFFIPISNLKSQEVMDSNPQFYDQLNVIQAIGFEALDGTAKVTIETDREAAYEHLPNETTRLTIKIKEVILAQKFQVARDVTEFDSPISFVSSFRDPVKEDDVLLVIEFKEELIEPEIQQSANLLTLVFEQVDKDSAEGFVVEEQKEEWAFDFRTIAKPNVKKVYRGELVSFDFKDADIRDVLRILSDISGFNIIIHLQLEIH